MAPGNRPNHDHHFAMHDGEPVEWENPNYVKRVKGEPIDPTHRNYVRSKVTEVANSVRARE